MIDKRVVLGYVYGSIAPEFMWSMLVATHMDKVHRKLIAGVPHKGGLYVEDNREDVANDFMAAKEFIENELTPPPWLLFVDADESFNLPDIYRLVDCAKEPGVYSGLYFSFDLDKTKTPPEFTCKSNIYRRKDNCWSTMSPIHSVGMHRVDGVGTGFCLIHRDVFTAIRKKYPEHPMPYFVRDRYSFANGEWERDSEDLAFCARATEVGFPIYYNGGIIVTHHKNAPIGLQTLEKFGINMGLSDNGFGVKPNA